MKSNIRSGRPAFTLIELMAVVTIIVILAALVVGGLGFVNERQNKEKAKIQISLLSKAIEDYHLDMGAYPGSDNTPITGDVSEELYQALFKDGYDYTNAPTPPAKWTLATRIYLPELDPRSSQQGWVLPTTSETPPIDLKITDPWGRPYLYRRGTYAQNPDFDLWSRGKDGQTDPVTKLRDDIRNF